MFELIELAQKSGIRPSSLPSLDLYPFFEANFRKIWNTVFETENCSQNKEMRRMDAIIGSFPYVSIVCVKSHF